jgi:hypothetical protein
LAAIDDLHIHDFRHLFCTTAAQSGASILQIKAGLSRICLKRHILNQKSELTLLPKKVLCYKSPLHLERVTYDPSIRRI